MKRRLPALPDGESDVAETWFLFYDSECSVCHASQLSCVRWALESGQKIEGFPIDSPEARDRGVGSDLTLVTKVQVFTAFEAWLVLARLGPWWIRWLPKNRWSWPMGRWFYRWFAQNRRWLAPK